MGTPRKRSKGLDPKRRREALSDMHKAATTIEGVLRKTIAAHEAVETLRKSSPRTLLRVGLQGLIRLLEEKT